VNGAEWQRGLASGAIEQGRAACDRDVGEADRWGPQGKIQFKTSNGTKLIRPKHYLPELKME
jgi:hypothetical protein